jgi:hypothetical protein
LRRKAGEGQSKTGMETEHLKNNIFRYQCLITFPQQNPSSLTHLPSYFARCSHGTGCTPAFGRAGGLWQRMAEVSCAGGVSLSHVPPEPLARAQPGQKAVTGRVASHTSIQVSTQTAGPHALDFPDFSMIRPETGRDNGKGRPEDRSPNLSRRPAIQHFRNPPAR